MILKAACGLGGAGEGDQEGDRGLRQPPFAVRKCFSRLLSGIYVMREVSGESKSRRGQGRGQRESREDLSFVLPGWVSGASSEGSWCICPSFPSFAGS